MERKGDNGSPPRDDDGTPPRAFPAAAAAASAAAAAVSANSLIEEIAGPLAELATLIDLVEDGKSPISARDMQAAGQRLLIACGKHDITREGRVGERRPFDPKRHEALTDADPLLDISLSPAEPLSPGQAVIVRYVGIGYQGQVLQKAGVERAP